MGDGLTTPESLCGFDGLTGDCAPSGKSSRWAMGCCFSKALLMTRKQNVSIWNRRLNGVWTCGCIEGLDTVDIAGKEGHGSKDTPWTTSSNRSQLTGPDVSIEVIFQPVAMR